jgi:hypothetical protein
MSNTQRRAEIVQIGHNNYSVKVNGNLVSTCLCEDEALGVLAAFIYRPEKVPFLRTPEDMARMEASRNKPDSEDLLTF